ncbi:NAD-dependent epimerase/dehydratase family protein [Candidatus Woesearchaeota archaeon]|nr:NAD-dependent epimerase/dehydratase family protein [Candidatus Woesearchaeota archaeon]
MKKKVLVTGGAGFIGSHVVDLLINKGHEVVVVDNLSTGYAYNLNPKATFIKGDLQDEKICKNAVKGVDVVYHLAAHAAEGQSIFCPVYNAKATYLGFLQLITCVINSSVKTFVNVGSMASYGNQRKLPFREEYLKDPQDPYAIHKYAIEKVLDSYSRLFGLNAVTIIPHNVYGPRQDISNPYRNVIGIFINRLLQNKPLIVYGDGLQKRAFTYIDDCAPYIVKAGFSSKAWGEKINIGSEEVVTIKHAAESVKRIFQSKSKIIFTDDRPLEVKEAFCSSDKARQMLGYHTSTSLEQGLEKMVIWAKSNGPIKFKYWKKLEIKRKVPTTWSKKLI